MIIFGWRTRQKTLNVLRGQCPVCHAERDIHDQSNRVWFTLFFLPIFPIRTVGQHRVCSHCGTIFPANITIEPQSAIATSNLNGPPQTLPQTSPTAIGALIIAVLSPILICLCYLSIPASIVAIILGHMSLNAIAKSDRRMDGRGLSIASLAVAYPVLLLSLFLMSYSMVLVYQRSNQPEMEGAQAELTDQDGFSIDSNAGAKARFQEAERSIMALQGDSPGRGNSPEAIRIAQSFSEMILEVRDTAFTKGKKPLFQLSSGQFITYVELHDDRALFLVHVPEYRKFSDEAKKQLAELAWTVAQLSVSDALPEDADLAVALKGTLMYGAIMKGYVTKHEGLRDHALPAKKQDLLAFFPEPSMKENPLEATVERPNDVESPARKSDVPMPNAASNSDAPADVVERQTSEERSPTPTSPPKPRPTRERFEAFEQKLSLTAVVKIPRLSWQYKSMAWSHHGKWLAAGKIDDTLTLFDASSGQALSEVKKLEDLDYFSGLAFSLDDRFLVATTNSGRSALLEVDEQGQLRYAGAMYRHARGANVVVCSPRHSFVASGGKDGTIAWQTLAVPSQTKLLQHLKKEPLTIWLPEEGTTAMAINGDSFLRFSLRDTSIVDEQPIAQRGARAASFSPDGSQIAMVDYQDVYWSDCRGRLAPIKIHHAKGDSLSMVVFHPNNRWIAVVGRGNVLILDVIDRQPIGRLVLESTASIETIQFSPDGKRLAASFQSTDTSIQIFEIKERP